MQILKWEKLSFLRKMKKLATEVTSTEQRILSKFNFLAARARLVGRNGQSTRILSEIINKAFILANSIRLKKKKESIVSKKSKTVATEVTTEFRERDYSSPGTLG